MKRPSINGGIPALFFGLLALSSCTERIELDLGDLADPKLVVEGWFTDQTMAHPVRLTMSGSYYENKPATTVSGALVTISDGNITHSLTEQPLGSGVYYTAPDVQGVVGNLYTLSVSYDGETYTASDLMRPVSPIDSVAFAYVDDIDYLPGEKPLYNVKIWTQELPGLGDHYRWKSFLNGVSQTDSLKNMSFVDDALYDGAQVNGVIVSDVRAYPGDTVRVEQHSITKAAYDIILGILNETEFRGGLFDPPPANVPSNVSNGALGFFGASSVKDRSAIIPQ